MSTMEFYRTNNEPAKQIFQSASVQLTDMPSFQVSYSKELTQNLSIDNSINFNAVSPKMPGSVSSTSYSYNIDTQNVSDLVVDSYRLRHQVFSEELDWDVVSYNGQEVDCYDMMSPYYAILDDDQGSVIGTWRALPTSGGYMLKDVFPELCRGEAPPERDDVWEISRFAVDKLTETYNKKSKSVCDPVKVLVDSFTDFAKRNDLSSLVAVTSTAGERMLKRLGVKVRRFGDGQCMQIGKVQSTAIWIDINN